MSSVLYNQACTTVQRVQWYKNHEATIPEKHFQCDGATLDSPPPPLATDREPRGLPATSLLPLSSPEKFPEQYERAESGSEKERGGEREESCGRHRSSGVLFFCVTTRVVEVAARRREETKEGMKEAR